MPVRLIAVPYHYGFQSEGEGAGLGVLALRARLARTAGLHAGVAIRHDPPADVPGSVASISPLIAAEVAAAREAGETPLLLSGGCSVCLGALAGLPAGAGVVWFDAHGDFNTPETTPSGFFDGMPLAIACGLAHRELRSRITSHPPLDPTSVVMAGVRDLDPGETDNLSRLQIVPLGAREASGPALDEAVERAARNRPGVYLHFDLDVLDPAEAPSVDYPAAGGLSLAQAEDAIARVARRTPVLAASLTAFNPARGRAGQTLRAATRIAETLVAALIASGDPRA
jgi:arginase